ncbi:MAG: glycoside hydrolase family 78 protein [Propionibacteriaceae bacterium]|jgi:alpha-L-rhamnosidase|nr:glycoside hydrolase family 78 protein [Propionibacteriaceae bacterium]
MRERTVCFDPDTQMISADAPRGVALRFRCRVDLAQPVEQVLSAVLLSTALGVYEILIDDHHAGEAKLSPGWTSYDRQLDFQCLDLSAQIPNRPSFELSALVGNGWYRGDLGWKGWNDLPYPINYGESLGFYATLDIEYQDGCHQRIHTNTSWVSETTGITANSLFDGQTTDMRIGRGAGLETISLSFDPSVLRPQIGPNVTTQERINPRRIWTSPSGSTLVDFGQNLAGWVHMHGTGSAGTEIVVRHAEALQDRELAVAPLRDALATDRYILSGGLDRLEPSFTYHGFRYAEISGCPFDLKGGDLYAVVVGSELRRTGWFECSDERVNQFVHNSIWSQKSNFFSIPTDCPNRDERLGWTGDISIYAPTACFQFDSADFLHSWLMTLAGDFRRTRVEGVPRVIPDIWDRYLNERFNAAIWSDATIWVPQALWNAYGDAGRLAEHYPAMAGYLGVVERHLSAEGLWISQQMPGWGPAQVGSTLSEPDSAVSGSSDSGLGAAVTQPDFQYGDWLDPDAPANDPGRAKADPSVVATACLYRSASFAAQAGRIIGASDAEHWGELAERTRRAFNQFYVSDGQVYSDCTTVYALALAFGLLDEKNRLAAAARLAELVREADYLATTGFVGTAYICQALSRNGYPADAYRLFLQNRCPSWLYQVEMGATTTWERWDSILPDGTLNDPTMTSLNHYAFGAVCDWLYQDVAGIQAAAPGYREILLKPAPGPGMDWVRASYDSESGPIEVSWRVKGSRFHFEASTPPVPARVLMPDGRIIIVRDGKVSADCAVHF